MGIRRMQNAGLCSTGETQMIPGTARTSPGTVLIATIYAMCCCQVTSVVSDAVRPHRRWPTRLPSLGFSRQEYWSGLHFLLQCMKVESESEVAQSCPTFHDPMDCSLPGSSVHGISQARVLEWVATMLNNLHHVT